MPVVWGDEAALSETDSMADALPANTGVKVMLTEQDPPAWTMDPHVLVCEKLAASVPVSTTAMPVRSAFPELVRVTVCAPDDVPTACEGKVMDVGKRLAIGTAG